MPAFLLPEGRAFSPPQAGAWEPSPAAEQTSGWRAAAGPDGGAWAARRPPAPHGPSGCTPHAPPPGSHGDSRHGEPTGRRSAAPVPAPAQRGPAAAAAHGRWGTVMGVSSTRHRAASGELTLVLAGAAASTASAVCGSRNSPARPRHTFFIRATPFPYKFSVQYTTHAARLSTLRRRFFKEI